MKKGFIKKFIVLIFVMFLFSYNAFSATVSDNDGSAFISKSEFDSLKNDFQAQINDYNNNIDNKLDQAINAYLEGVVVEKTSELNSIINNIDQKFVDSSTFGWPSSRLGSYKKYFINLGMAVVNQGRGGTLNQVQYETGAVNNVQWKTVNTSNYGIYYYGTKTDEGYYELKKYTNSRAYSSVAGVYESTGSFGATVNSITIPSVTYTNDDTDSFGSYTDRWPLALGGVNTNILVTKSFGIVDTLYNPELDYVTGNKLILDTNSDNIDDDVYFLESKNANVPGNLLEDVVVDYMGYEIRTDTGSQLKGWTTVTDTSIKNRTKLRIYHHKYDTIKRSQILNAVASKIYGQNIFYYNGLPIFKNISKKGKVQLKLHFDNDAGYDTVFVVSDVPFDNTALPTTGYTTTELKPNYLIYAADNSTITMSFDVDSGKTYWIKARPLGSGDLTKPTKITTKEIKLSYN